MQHHFQHIFTLAKKQDRSAQKSIFETFAPKMLAIAKSYVGSTEDAEDVLMESFYKAFSKIDDCRNAESFGFWLRKIVVNNAINFIRKNKNLLYADEFCEEMHQDINDENDDFLDFDLVELLAEMPLGYKMVFNLYVFEEKKHLEIAEILNISEGTSKSQLNKAKKWLVESFKKQRNEQFIEK